MRAVVALIAQALDFPTAERLKPQLSRTATLLASQGTLTLTFTLEGELAYISVSTLWRLLAHLPRDLPPAAGEYVCTLHMVDVAIGWSECYAIQGLGDCSSRANACTLQTTLAQAGSGDQIRVQKGVHYPGTTRDAGFILKSGVALYGGFADGETSLDAPRLAGQRHRAERRH